MDWYPRGRDDQVHMTNTWLGVFQTKANAWSIPAEKVTALTSANARAKTVLEVVKGGKRTPESVIECNQAFAALEELARYIKSHYLLTPPLERTDLAALLLKQPDLSPTPVPPPSGQPEVTLTYPGGPHRLEVHLRALTPNDSATKESDYGYAIFVGLMPPGGATLEQAASDSHYLMKRPVSGNSLLHWKFTHRKSEVIEFLDNETGMTAFVCARYENAKGERGAWGNVASSVVP